MTLKKSVGIGGLFIISLSVAVAISFGLMIIKLKKVEATEQHFIEVNESLNQSFLELIPWMDGMGDHVMDEWPFEGELDPQKSELGKWIESYKPIGDEDKKIVAALKQKNIELFQSARKIVNTDDIELKREIYSDEFREIADSIKPIIGGLANFYQENVAAARDRRIELQEKAGVFIIIASMITIMCVIFAVVAIFKWVIKPLHRISHDMVAVGQGDLSVRIHYKWNNEIGSIARNFNKMIQALSDIIERISTSSTKVVATVNILKERAEKTSEGAQNQHNQTEQAATAAEEMRYTITDIAQNATQAAETSSEAISIAEKGKNVADGAIDTVKIVHSTTEALSEGIEKLNSSVSEIGEIVTVISNIADQTNLLALNAAIEAARAGDQGRGFAVVADEVRKLAESTMKATTEITEKIRVVQEDSKHTKESMDEASGVVVTATEFIEKVGESLQSIVDSVMRVRDQVTQIATAVDEQSVAAGEVTKNMTQTSAISNDMQKMSIDVLNEVNSLTHVAEELMKSTAGFKVNGNGSHPNAGY